MAAWTEYVGIFDASCGSFGTPSYDPGLIDVSAKTEGVNFIILDVIKIKEVNSPEVKIMKLPLRMNMPAGLGKTELTVDIAAYVTRRELGAKKGSAISKYNLFKKFVDQHDEMSDTAIYLVQRERNADDNGWDYAEYEDISSPTHNFDVEFLKGKCSGITKNYATYGYIEFSIQFVEAWF